MADRKCDVCEEYNLDLHDVCSDNNGSWLLCAGCIKNAVSAEQGLNPIPDCNCCEYKMDATVIAKVLEENYDIEYKRFSRKLEDWNIIGSNCMIRCHKCEDVLNRDMDYEDGDFVWCGECCHDICWDCKSISYGSDHACDGFDKDEMFKILDEAFVSCPGCKILITRESGCRAIICAMCGMKFCWGCQEEDRDIRNYGHKSDCNDEEAYVFADM
jgi:hypothetical protein